ncbi:MAG: ABC transporter permease [Ignavibacteriaceae bacterium]|jgi:putative ABC transport system permease protein|nr:ABC transporter permease [Ignavibacteriaceae bacterium]
MLIFEIIKVAINSLRANRLRSLLTILGIVVGIFSIIAISTVIEMLQKSIEEGVSQLGQNTFQIQKFPAVRTGSAAERAKIRNRRDITLEEFYRFKEKMVEAKSVGAEQWTFGRRFEVGNKETNPNVQFGGVTPEAFANNKWNIDDGRAFNDRDVQGYNRSVVLGPDLVKTLFGSINPIGQEVKVDGHKLTVVGVLESQGDVFGMSQDNFALIPITTFQSFYGKRSNSVNITVMTFGKEDYKDLIGVAEGYFRTVRGVTAGEENDFDIRTNEQVLSQINDITSGVRIGSYVVGGIALLAAGIGIMNIMLVSVTERTREIGIRKAIGAKKVNILVQFIIEAIVLSLIGGIIGIFLGVTAGNVAGSFLNAEAVLPIDWILIGIFLCMLIGVGFGTYPAYKASNLDPIEALRFE